MAIFSLLLAAGSFFALTSAAPASAAPAGRRMDTYHFYQGAAEVQNWPTENEWYRSYDSMFKANGGILQQSCAQWGVPNNSGQEIEDIYNVINEVSSETNVDPRFIFAVMLQESNGCVRAPTTNYGVRNPGLMQSHNGVGTCNDQGAVLSPCPTQRIHQMIRDGVAGTSSGDGLVQLLQSSRGPQDTKYFQAARKYNSGSVDGSGNLSAGIATKCYASDVANRLTGWVRSANQCPLDGRRVSDGVPLEAAEVDEDFSWMSKPAQAVKPAVVEAPQPATPKTQPAAKPALAPAPAVPAVPAAPTKPVTPAPVAVAPVDVRIKAVSNKMAPGVTANCAQYYQIQSGDFCNSVAEKFKISFTDLRNLNTKLDASCTNLWLGYDYCVKAL